MKFLPKISSQVLIFAITTGTAWAKDPVPDIKVNGSDEPVSITTNDNVSVTVAIDSGDMTNSDTDSWALADTPVGWYYYEQSVGWQLGQSPMSQGSLLDQPSNEILKTSSLPSGSYTFYFGVDMDMNGVIDMEQMFYDSVMLNVTLSNKYNIPDTGQAICYNNTGEITCPAKGEAFYGQDAQYTRNAPSYTNNGDGTVTDNVTGLIWQKTADTDGDGDIDAADKLSNEAAAAYCENLSLAGHTDWQLPNIKQLYSLMNFSGLDPSGYEGTDTSGLVPFIDTNYFDFAYGDTNANERIIDSQYASSTLYVADTTVPLLFGVNFADGRIKGYGITRFGQDKTFLVACIRENSSYGVNDFSDNGNGIVTDNATGLMWAQNDSGSGLNWEQALAYVKAQNDAKYLGYSDWRLPNVKELQSIVDYSRSPDTTNSAAIDPLFKATSITNEAGETDYAFYWSNTTHANWTDQSGGAGAYVSFGRSLGYMNDTWSDVHGAGSQRSDPKSGDPAEFPTGRGPQGDAIRIYNYVRLVRGGTTG